MRRKKKEVINSIGIEFDVKSRRAIADIDKTRYAVEDLNEALLEVGRTLGVINDTKWFDKLRLKISRLLNKVK